MINKKVLTTTLVGLVSATMTHARDLPVPHGPEIESRAAACGLGEQHGEFGVPLGQISKAGQYNGYCHDLTDAEICLAGIKRSMNDDGKLAFQAFDTIEKTKFCLETFRKDLLAED